MDKSKILDHEAFELLRQYSIPHPPYALARTSEEAVEIAEKIGFPVVLKIVSPDISHKTDVGGVILGLSSREDVIKGFEQIMSNVQKNAPQARITGILVQKMVKPGVEIIIGGKRDEVFGVILLLGIGGVFTEVFRDVALRVLPIDKNDIYEMIEELRGKHLLKGYRGLPPANIDAIVDTVIKFSKLLEEHEEIESADLNPVFVYPDGVLVVDARFILRRK